MTAGTDDLRSVDYRAMRRALRHGGDYSKQWAANLREARQIYGISQRQLADLLGVSREVIANIETERIGISEPLRIAVAYVLDDTTLFPMPTWQEIGRLYGLDVAAVA